MKTSTCLRFALVLVLGSSLGCREKTLTGGSGSGGPADCSDMCKAFDRGQDCDGVDRDLCVADCEALITQRDDCKDLGDDVVACLADGDFVCLGPGDAMVEGSSEDPAYLYGSQGTLTVRDVKCVELIHAFDDCLSGKTDLTQPHTYEAEGTALSHGVGEQVGDAWQCRPDICYYDHMIYGPYVWGDPAALRAVYRVSAECDTSNTDPLGSVDEPSTGASRQFTCADLVGDFHDFTLDFDYQGGQIETRMFYGEVGTITVDYVRLEPR